MQQYSVSILSPLLYSLFGLFLGGFLLLLCGHRIKRGHWLVSLFCLGTIVYLSDTAIKRLFPLSGEAPLTVVVILLVGVGVIAAVEHWNALGQVTFTMVLISAVSFLIYAGQVILISDLGPLSMVFSLLLFGLEFLSLVLMVFNSFEIIDVLCRIQWKRIAIPQPIGRYHPKVSLHVPAYNEPPEMVIETLDALAKIDYPNYEVIMIDDNTKDENLWRPIEAHCRQLGFKFFHLENWPGFKSGALNYALRQTDPEAEIVGVVDSDYIVQPNYLKDLVGFFEEPTMAFVQTPQDYRDVSTGDRYAAACYRSYRYFFKLSMASRNERNGIIFAGTMGLIRKNVLEEMGGWDEWCITEDAEVSLRILSKGYQSLYVDQSYGKGLMPLNFEGLRKQRFRWAFGGMQILRLHWRALLPGTRWFQPENRLTLGQKFDYWSGSIQWLSDPLTFAFTVLLLISGLSYSLTRSVFLQPMAGAITFIPVTFILFGLTKFLWALRIRLSCTFKEACQAFLVLLSLTWVVTLACSLGLIRKEGIFLRTPKQRGKVDFLRSMQVVGKETMLSLMSFIGALLVLQPPITSTVLLLSGLLCYQGLIYGSAWIVNGWSDDSETLATNPVRLRMSRTTGERFRAMISEYHPARWTALGALLTALLFYAAVVNAPEEEEISRAKPMPLLLIPQALINNPPETQIKAKILLEEQAALSKDIDAAVAIWSADGVIRDANYTPNDHRDDRVWIGPDQIRSRYREEFKKRSYLKLHHQSLSLFLEGDEATAVNDLDAIIKANGRVQKVFLSKGDRWTFREENGEWKITSLTLNQAPR